MAANAYWHLKLHFVCNSFVFSNKPSHREASHHLWALLFTFWVNNSKIYAFKCVVKSLHESVCQFACQLWFASRVWSHAECQHCLYFVSATSQCLVKSHSSLDTLHRARVWNERMFSIIHAAHSSKSFWNGTLKQTLLGRRLCLFAHILAPNVLHYTHSLIIKTSSIGMSGFYGCWQWDVRTDSMMKPSGPVFVCKQIKLDRSLESHTLGRTHSESIVWHAECFNISRF